MKVAQSKSRIISNQRLSGNYQYLEFESSLIAKRAVAGQFVDIKVADGLVPLLRRPFSIYGAKVSKVKVIYKIFGEGTQALAKRKPGELLDIIGPLGNGFKYSSSLVHRLAPILVAGGMGVAPLLFLAEKIAQLKTKSPQSETLVLIGAKTKEQIYCAQEFKALGCTVKLATDDGSVGFKGRVTDLLKHLLSLVSSPASSIYSCGPHPMLKAVAGIAEASKINAQLSLEKHMACGIGACLGCVVATKAGYKTVCKDGPVFSSQELIW